MDTAEYETTKSIDILPAPAKGGVFSLFRVRSNHLDKSPSTQEPSGFRCSSLFESFRELCTAIFYSISAPVPEFGQIAYHCLMAGPFHFADLFYVRTLLSQDQNQKEAASSEMTERSGCLAGCSKNYILYYRNNT